MEELKSISEIDAKVTRNPNAVVVVYKPECPWCKKLISDLKKVEGKVPYKIYLINYKVGAPLLRRLGSGSVPAILAFVECELQGFFDGYDESIVGELNKLYANAKNICRVDLSRVLFEITQLGEPIL